MLVVVAHPDDETFGTGSVIANAAGLGHDVTVCCATRGEAGKDESGATSSPDELAKVREAELRAAAGVLGARDVVVLEGFADSGFEGQMPPRGLAVVPIEEVVSSVFAVVQEAQPHVVVTLDPKSVADHRDHARIGEATTLAFERADLPEDARLYHWTMPCSAVNLWKDDARARGFLLEYSDSEIGRADADITTIVDVGHVRAIRDAAIAEHRTQTPPTHGSSPAVQEALLCWDHLVRVVPPWTGGPIETSLFDGI